MWPAKPAKIAKLSSHISLGLKKNGKVQLEAGELGPHPPKKPDSFPHPGWSLYIGMLLLFSCSSVSKCSYIHLHFIIFCLCVLFFSLKNCRLWVWGRFFFCPSLQKDRMPGCQRFWLPVANSRRHPVHVCNGWRIYMMSSFKVKMFRQTQLGIYDENN